MMPQHNVTVRFVLTLVFLFATLPAHAFGVSISRSVESPRPAGTTILFGVEIAGQRGPNMEYQFSVVDLTTGKWRMLSDFSRTPLFPWTSIHEGMYLLVGVARDRDSNETRVGYLPYLLSSRVANGLPVVSATKNSLVGLFSAPPCNRGTVRVRYRNLLGSPWQRTPLQACSSARGVNSYIAGLLPATRYLMQTERYVDGRVEYGPIAWFQSGVLSTPIELPTVTDPPDQTTSVLDGILISAYLVRGGTTNYFLATDLLGRPVWYYDEIANGDFNGTSLVRPVAGGTMLLLMRRGSAQSSILREIDLAGNTVRETNIYRVSDQLAVLGQDRITSFHHEARRLDNGHTLVIASAERILTDVQGPGPVGVLGDMIIDLDENFQVAWVWNGFDHLDVTEKALLDEVCTSAGDPGCPPVLRSDEANDWMHANSVAYSPADGNLVLSVRHHDSVYKIDYADGTGSGEIVWRLGLNGDFRYNSNALWPQFSHQHDAHYEGPLLVVYDNGNLRRQTLGPAENSRGQVLWLDELNRIAHLVGNFDLGVYAPAVGSAQRLGNGNFHFLSGFIAASSHESKEVQPNGVPSFASGGPGAVYRSFRVRNLYAPE